MGSTTLVVVLGSVKLIDEARRTTRSRAAGVGPANSAQSLDDLERSSPDSQHAWWTIQDVQDVRRQGHQSVGEQRAADVAEASHHRRVRAALAGAARGADARALAAAALGPDVP